MKIINAIYKFGHLYDQETQQRILIEDGTKVSISIPAEQILKEDLSIAQKEKPLGSSSKYLQLDSKYGTIIPYWLLLKTGKSLFFRISGFLPKKNGKEAFSLEFRMTLLEDLYIYNKKRDNPTMANLFPCKCVIEECLTDDFDFFEPVYGDSLNKARTKLYELYFSRVANPASNAFFEFFISKDYKNKKDNLNSLRIEIQKKKSSNKEDMKPLTE